MKTLAMLVVVWVMLAALAIATAAAAPAPHKIKPPNDVGSLTALCRHYVRVEKSIATSSRVAETRSLLAHWDELHALRVSFTKLERRGELRKLKDSRRVSMRHVLAQLLGEQSDMSLDADGGALLERAHSRRTEDLFALSELARRAFDIATADVNGSWAPT